jgi:hypothetical protein
MANKTAVKNEKGNRTKPTKSILWIKGKPTTPKQMPMKKSADTGVPAQGTNNNVIMRNSK